MNTATKIAVTIGSIAVIATAGVGGLLLAMSNDQATNSSNASVSSTQTPTSSSSSPSVNTSSTSTPAGTATSLSSYKDGTYTATANYSVPHGSNTISATITISGGTITAVTANDNYTDGESVIYIDSFESSVSSAVVGRSLADASFSRIGGASLTTEGFNSVLDTIRSQATA